MRKTAILLSVAVAALMGAPAWADPDTDAVRRPGFSVGFPTDPDGRSAYGLYLSGRLAMVAGDMAGAADYIAAARAVAPFQELGVIDGEGGAVGRGLCQGLEGRVGVRFPSTELQQLRALELGDQLGAHVAEALRLLERGVPVPGRRGDPRLDQKTGANVRRGDGIVG